MIRHSDETTATSVETTDVTVVIPAYMRRSVIRRCLLSVGAQTARPAEVIVVDDGSTDGTAELAEDSGARVLRQENAGPGGARNAGLAAARTTWVAFLDSDDEWLPHHLRYLTEAATSESLIGSNARAVPSGALRGHPHRTATSLDPAAMLFPASPLSTSAIMVRREPALDVGGFGSMRLGEDRDLWCRLLERGTGLALPDVTVLYHEHETQVSGDTGHMLRARRELIEGYTGRTWMTPRLSRSMDAMTAWDELRVGVRDRAPRTALLAAGSLVRNRSAVPALAVGLRYRSALRDR